jgi:hypothetical protein
MNRASKEAVSEHPKPHEWQSNMLREENFAYRCGNLCKRISNAANNQILK